MEWVLHEVALVAAARLQPQHAIARGARQRAARQVLARHVLRNGRPCVSDHLPALMRGYSWQRPAMLFQKMCCAGVEQVCMYSQQLTCTPTPQLR